MDYISQRSALYVCIAVCFCVLTYLGLSAKQKDVIKQKLAHRKQQKYKVGAPPGPLTTEEEQPHAGTSRSPSHVKAFPPSQRSVLPGLVKSWTVIQRKALGDLSFDEEESRRSLLGDEEDYRTARDDQYSYAGFSVREIKALGDFPDYATLSGVPLPQPYKDFDYTKAVFRPYRPFRWAYHQTMCEY